MLRRKKAARIEIVNGYIILRKAAKSPQKLVLRARPRNSATVLKPSWLQNTKVKKRHCHEL